VTLGKVAGSSPVGHPPFLQVNRQAPAESPGAWQQSNSSEEMKLFDDVERTYVGYR
jgi:hypothetical protein